MTTIIKIPPEKLQQASFALARKVLDSGFSPTHIIALWRGGTFVGLCVHEFFKAHGVPANLLPVIVKSYDENTIAKQKSRAFVDISLIAKEVDGSSRILVVDDIFDTGRSMQSFLDALKAERIIPAAIRIAVVHLSSDNKTVPRIEPDYFFEKVPKGAWVNYPHEMAGLSLSQIKKVHGSKIASLIDKKRFVGNLT